MDYKLVFKKIKNGKYILVDVVFENPFKLPKVKPFFKDERKRKNPRV